jgi:YVTN family beta-propeller protein
VKGLRAAKRSGLLLAVLTLGCAALTAQSPDLAELGGKPFAIHKTWMIGGEGNWDYLTLDPVALRLYIAHGPVVQVVDLSTGKLAGTISGMRDAHGIALDDTGGLGYVSDGPNNEVKVFDRRTLEVTATVRTGPNPRSIVFDPASRLVFVICTEPYSDGAPPGQNTTRQAATPSVPRRTGLPGGIDTQVRSVITVVDGETSKRLADLLVPGKLGFAQTDGNGRVYVNITDRNLIAHFDGRAVETEVHRPAARAESNPPVPLSTDDVTSRRRTGPLPAIHAELTLDWSSRLQFFPLGSACLDPRSLAVDPNHFRLFAACNNRKLDVLNSDTGEVVATLPIGPGTDAVAYDANRGLIYTANGGDLGSVTVIRQHVTDSYAVIQDLPTRERARTLAVNPQTGEIYVVTNMSGFDLSQPGTGGGAHTLPVVQATPVKGSFQVLVIGN